MSGVLVLNASYEPLQKVSVKHAIKMLVREVAVIQEADEEEMFGTFPVPKILRLVRYIAQKWIHNGKPRWSKTRVLIRDHHKCGYCKGPATTIDHILPSSRGGLTTWKNTVAACTHCNNKKDNRTPEEAGMKLKATPFVPSWWQIGH